MPPPMQTFLDALKGSLNLRPLPLLKLGLVRCFGLWTFPSGLTPFWRGFFSFSPRLFFFVFLMVLRCAPGLARALALVLVVSAVVEIS